MGMAVPVPLSTEPAVVIPASSVALVVHNGRAGKPLKTSPAFTWLWKKVPRDPHLRRRVSPLMENKLVDLV